MKLCCLIALSAAVVTVGYAADADDWDYANTNWEEVNPEYSTCGTGTSQAPIDVKNGYARSYNVRPVITQYESTLEFNGGSNNFNFGCKNVDTPCSTIEYQQLNYSMLQLHSHSPSEHTLNGQSFALELHFVHASDEGALGVLAIFFRIGASNEYIQAMLDAANAAGSYTVDLNNMFHQHSTMCIHKGSLTTPPCSEGVTFFTSWGVMEISADQMFQFRALTNNVKTNRPLQPLNGRDIICTH